ncbi:MAG TPA: CpsD/CapB family tyrosine-protein kinase [Gammaproteobacteria bacterium]|jgi:Mrp family chromosome partitioning ATPase
MSKIEMALRSAKLARNRRYAITPPPQQFRESDFDNIPIVAPDADILFENRVLTPATDSLAHAAYKMLRTRVLQRMRSDGLTSLAITSCAAGDGKTITAVNLAISLSEEMNQRVVLVDLDLRRPNLDQRLGLSPKHGLSDYLRGDVSLADILLRPFERLILVPTTTPVWNSSENLNSPRMKTFTEEIQSMDTSALIVYDLPPMLASDDFLSFSPQVDAVLLVIAERKTPRSALKEARGMIDAAKLIGVVLNMSDAKLAAYY